MWCVGGGGEKASRPSSETKTERVRGGVIGCVWGGGVARASSRKKTKQKVYMQLPYHLPYFERVQFS